YVNSNTSSTPGNFTVTETTPVRPPNTSGDTITHYFSGEYQTETIVNDAALGLLSTTIVCYKGNFTNCPAPSSVPTLPITKEDVYTSFNGSTTASLTETQFDSTYGNLLDVYSYDSVTTPPTAPPGAGSQVLQRALVYGSWNSATQSCSTVGNNIYSALCYEWD